MTGAPDSGELQDVRSYFHSLSTKFFIVRKNLQFFVKTECIMYVMNYRASFVHTSEESAMDHYVFLEAVFEKNKIK